MATTAPKPKGKVKSTGEKKTIERIEHEGLLDVRNLTTYFKLGVGDVKAVQDVSFVLKPGESLGLAGESGCGKTTAALSHPQAAAGERPHRQRRDPLRRTQPRQAHRVRHEQDPLEGDQHHLPGGDERAQPGRARPASRSPSPSSCTRGSREKQSMVRARELFDLVGINPKRVMDFPHQLSGGMRQRAMIAMALACNPKLVIGDEPTTALDVMVQAQILELIARLRKELDLSFILISHDLSVMAETCDKGVVMYAGEVVESGTTADIFNNATHPVHAPAHQGLPEHPREARDGQLHQGRPAQPHQPARRAVPSSPGAT